MAGISGKREGNAETRVVNDVLLHAIVKLCRLASAFNGSHKIEMGYQLCANHELSAISFRVTSVQSTVGAWYQSTVPKETRLLGDCHSLDEVLDAVLSAVETILVGWQGFV